MRKENACALSLISPLFLAAGRLSGPSGRKPPADKGNAQKAKGAKLQLFERFCALGNVWPHIFLIYGSLGRAFALPQGTGDRLLPGPGKQKLSAGAHPERIVCVRDWAQAKTRCAICSPRARTRKEPRACETRGRERHGARLARRSRAPGTNRGRARLGEKRGRANRFAGGRRTTGCIAGDKAACADSPAPGRRVRELPGAAAQAGCEGRLDP